MGDFDLGDIPHQSTLGPHVRGIDGEDIIQGLALQDSNYQNRIKGKLNTHENDINETFERIQQNITEGNRVVATQLFELITTLKGEIERIKGLSVTNDANKLYANRLIAQCGNIREEYLRLMSEPAPEVGGGKQRKSKKRKHSRMKRTGKKRKNKTKKTKKRKKGKRQF